MKLVAVVLFILAVGTPPAVDAHSPTILFDQGHGQRFIIEMTGDLHLSELAELGRKRGADVVSTNNKLSKTQLRQVDGLIISGAFQPLSPGEVDTVVDYLIHGGNLAVMLHIPMPHVQFLERLGILTSNGVIRVLDNRIENHDKDFVVTTLAPHPLTSGLTHFSVYGGWALLAQGPFTNIIASTSPTAWIDLNGNNLLDAPPDAQQALGVIAAGQLGSGRFVVFGDDAIFQNRFLTGENRRLGMNLVDFLLLPHPVADH